MLRPIAVQRRQQCGKSDLLRRVLRRKVAADVERLQLGGEEDVVRPAAVARHQLPREHIDVVDVRALLAVDQHVDEPAVHQRGDLRIAVERALRHMAPVAGKVADREKNRLVLAPRLVQRLLPPRVPVHRVVGMFQQIRIVRRGQAVGRNRRHRQPNAAGCEGKQQRGEPQQRAHQPGSAGAKGWASARAIACSRAACTACAIAADLPPACATCCAIAPASTLRAACNAASNRARCG